MYAAQLLLGIGEGPDRVYQSQQQGTLHLPTATVDLAGVGAGIKVI